MNKKFYWLWTGQLISNLGTQAALYSLGLWSYGREERLADFAAVAIAVQVSKVMALPLVRRLIRSHPRGQLMLLANGISALCTLSILAYSLSIGDISLPVLLPLLAMAAMMEAIIIISFASLIPIMITQQPDRARATGLFASIDGLVACLAPFLGGWLINSYQLKGVLLVDLASFIVAIYCVLQAWSPVLSRTIQWKGPLKNSYRLRQLIQESSAKPLIWLSISAAFVYGVTELLFPAWLLAASLGNQRFELSLILGASGYFLGYQFWRHWGWNRPKDILKTSILVQSIILIGAGFIVFESWLIFWSAGILIFSICLPLVLASLQAGWQQLAPPAEMPGLLAQKYRLEWTARLGAFIASGLLVDQILTPALKWPYWPNWVILNLTNSPGRPLAAGLCLMGFILLIAILRRDKECPSPLKNID